jgi:hypothetical protein
MTNTNTKDRLDRARASLAETNNRIGNVQARRKVALLNDVKPFEIGKIDAELKGLRHAAEVETDRIELLLSEQAREQAEAAAQRHEVHLRGFERLLEQADIVGDELEAAVAMLEQKFRETIRLRELALSMWPFGKSSHGDAVARTPEGCALAAGAVVTLLQHELHRVGSEARLGGSPGERVKVPLPGGAPARLTPLVDRKTGQLVPLEPLGAVLRRASQFAVSTMRGNLFVPPVVEQPAPKGPRLVFGGDPAPIAAAPAPTAPAAPKVGAPTAAPAQPPATGPDMSAEARSAKGDTDPLREYVPPEFRARLAALHARQAQLANDVSPEGEANYEKVVAEIATLQNEIERARNGATAA